MDTLPLHSTHDRNGATFGERGGREIIRHYGAPDAEYQAAREAAALVDLSSRDALRITGEDRLTFLHGMCTNDITGLEEWANTYAAMITVKGAMVADLRVVRRPDDLIVDLEPGTLEAVRGFLDKYLISEDAELHDARGEVAVLGLVGPKSQEIARAAFGVEGTGGAAAWEGERVVALPSLLTRGEGLDLLVPRGRLEAAWARLLDVGGPLGLRPAGLDALEQVRVEDGVPRFGQDLLETTIPLEAGLTHAIHYKKGCYVGQEVIARATFRGQVNKKLVRLHLGEGAPDPKAELRREGKKVGFITSVVRSPREGQFVGMGYVHRDHLSPGTELEIADAATKAIVQAQ